MKKILLTLSMLLIITGVSAAEKDDGYVMSQPNDYVKVRVVCINGYVFAVAAIGGQYNAGRGVSIIQVMNPSTATPRRTPPQPATCSE